MPHLKGTVFGRVLKLGVPVFLVAVMFVSAFKAGSAVIGYDISTKTQLAATEAVPDGEEKSNENVSVDETVSNLKGEVSITSAGECASREIARLTGQARIDREKKCAHKKGTIKWKDENGKEQMCVRTEGQVPGFIQPSGVPMVCIGAAGCAVIKTQCTLEGSPDGTIQQAIRTGGATFTADGTDIAVPLNPPTNISEPFNDTVFNAFNSPEAAPALQQYQAYNAEQAIKDAASGGNSNLGNNAGIVNVPQTPNGAVVDLTPKDIPGNKDQNPANQPGNVVGNLAKGENQTFPYGNPVQNNEKQQNIFSSAGNAIADFFKGLFGFGANPMGSSQNPNGTGVVPGNGGTNPNATGSINNPIASQNSNTNGTTQDSANPFKNLIDALFKPFSPDGVLGGVDGGVKDGNVGGIIGSTGTIQNPDGKIDGEVDREFSANGQNEKGAETDNENTKPSNSIDGTNPEGNNTNTPGIKDGSQNGALNVGNNTPTSGSQNPGNPNAQNNPDTKFGSLVDVKNPDDKGAVAVPEAKEKTTFESVRDWLKNALNWADRNLCLICGANARQLSNAEVQNAAYPYAQYHSEIDRKYGLPDGALRRTCKVESGSQCSPNAYNRDSGATGQFQIIYSTWIEWCQASLRQSAAWCGANANLRYNYQVSSEATALRMQQRLNQHAALFRDSKINPILGLYLMHFNGDGNGTRYLRALATNPNISAESILINRNAVVNANRSIYMTAGATGVRYRTVMEVAQLFANKLQVPVFTDQPFVPGNIQTQTATVPRTISHVFGDSLGAGVKTAGNLKGNAAQNLQPNQILQNIKNYISQNPGELNGKHVVLSTGISNAPSDAQLATIKEQIEVLKTAVGENGSVTVLGAGTRADIAPFNQKLEQLAAQTGVKFQALPAGSIGTDKVHLDASGYKAVLNTISAGVTPAPNQQVPPPSNGQVPPPNQQVPPPNQQIPPPNQQVPPYTTTGPVGYPTPIGQPGLGGTTFPQPSTGGGVTNPGIQQPLPPQLSCTPPVLANPETEKVTVMWACTYGSIAPSGFSGVGAAGSTQVTLSPSASGVIRYSAQCVNGGYQSAPVSCEVQVRRPVTAIVAQPAQVSPGSTARISWSGLNAKSCMFDGPNAIPRPVETTGALTVGPLSRSSTFEISCVTQSGFEIIKTTTVGVEGDAEKPLEPAN